MHYLEIVEPDRNDKDKKDNNKLKRRSGESLNIEYSKNVRARTDESYDKSSLSRKLIGNVNDDDDDDELDWSKIKLDFTEENVIMSREDFSIIINHINQMKSQLDSKSYHIDEHEE